MEVIWKNGRDNSRTPMQWNTDANAGFTTGTPWLKLNENYTDINVEQAMQDPNSIYHYYKKLIELRKDGPVLVYGTYDLIVEDHEQVYAYTRTFTDETVLVITNLFAEETKFSLPENLLKKSAQLLLSNYDVVSEETLENVVLKPYEARVYKIV